MTDAELLAEIEATPPARPRARGSQIVNIPGVGDVEFPAGMSDAEITAAARGLHMEANGVRTMPSHTPSTPTRTGPPTMDELQELERRVRAGGNAAHLAQVQAAIQRAKANAASAGAPPSSFATPPRGTAGGPTPSESEMMRDLAAADAAGDTELAQRIAGQIRAARARGTAPESTYPPKPGMAESGARGALQGASFGFADEASGAIAATLPFLDREATSPGLSDLVKGTADDSWAGRYRRARDFYRNRNTTAEEANPGTYFAGQLTGSVVAPGGAIGSTAKGLKGAAAAIGQGAVAGAGYSGADLTRGDVNGLVRDMETGGGFGLGGYGAGRLLRRALAKVAQSGAERVATAQAKAGAQAAEEIAGGIRSATGHLGSETQQGSRYVENLMRLEASMTPEQRALYAKLQATGVVPHLQQSVAQGTLEALPGQAGTIAARRAELEALQSAAPAAAAARTRELLTPQVGADTRSMWRSYGEPWAIGLGTYGAARAVGLDNSDATAAGALMGLLSGRTRAGKALRTRIGRPAHQAAIGEAQQKIAQSRAAQALMEVLRRGAPAVATDAEVRREENARAQAELDRLLSE